MPTLFETIKIVDGEAQNIEYHQDRFNRSRFDLFGSTAKIDLASLIDAPNNELFRCKIVYAENIISVDYFPYIQKKFKKFIILETEIDYSYKYTNRDYFDKKSNEYNKFDDIIFCKNGLISDTTIANIAFYDGSKWLTPKTPLLYGTTRARLLDNRLLIEKDIKSNEISKYKRFAIMNAMIGFYEVKDFTIKGI